MNYIEIITAQGASNNSYRFEVYPHNTTFNDIGAVYIFAKKNGSQYEPLYIGESGELGKRIANHEKMPRALAHGCNCICVHQEPNYQTRLDKETDLRRAYPNTVCNDQ